MENYTVAINEISSPKYEQVRTFQNSNHIKKFLLKLMYQFFPSKAIALDYTDKEQQDLNSYLLEYVNIDNQLWDYNLKDNLTSALVSFIMQNAYSKEYIPNLLEECVIPDLEKLGLVSLIPKLKAELEKAFEYDSSIKTNSWELSPIEKSAIQENQQQIAKKYSSYTQQISISSYEKIKE